MIVSESISISSADASQVGQARRRAASLAKLMGFDELRAGELSIIVTEVARNIAAHAGEGTLILAPWTLLAEPSEESKDRNRTAAHPDSTSGIDVYALDHGKGIDDIEQAGEDGFSTSGTAGEGLGAISRLAENLQIFSVTNPALVPIPTAYPQTPSALASHSGTILFSRILRTGGHGRESRESRGGQELRDRQSREISQLALQFGAITVPLPGESVSGDAWCSSVSNDRSVHLVVDGLGHGQMASEAAVEAVRIFKSCCNLGPELILKEIHAGLTKTRGAAVSVAEVLPHKGVLNYSGAGNIAAAIYTGGNTKSLVSMNGTVGHAVQKFQQFSHSWERNSLLIMHSDGIQTRWNVEQYSGLGSRHPALIAAVLYRDFRRERDDATVLVVR